MKPQLIFGVLTIATGLLRGSFTHPAIAKRCCDLRFSQGETPKANAAALRYRTSEDEGMQSLFSREDRSDRAWHEVRMRSQLGSGEDAISYYWCLLSLTRKCDRTLFNRA